VINASRVPIQSQVLIAPHHGADNGSSTCFIKAVNPKFVIFSAGSIHHHPRTKVAKRYTDNGVKVENMFRTDRGDDEGGTEWKHGRIENCNDSRGDDDIEIIFPQQGKPKVAYRQSSQGC